MSKEILAKNTNYLDNVLETLDMQQHTIGVMFVIAAKFTHVTVRRPLPSLASRAHFSLALLQGSPTDSENIIKYVRDFVNQSNTDQIRLASGNCKIHPL